jgi:hypothetical protein
MRDACGLAGRSGSGHRCGIAHLTRSNTGDITAADLRGDVELATGKGPCPGDGIAGTAISGSFRLKEAQHALRAVRRPRRHDPTVGLA